VFKGVLDQISHIPLVSYINFEILDVLYRRVLNVDRKTSQGGRPNEYDREAPLLFAGDGGDVAEEESKGTVVVDGRCGAAQVIALFDANHSEIVRGVFDTKINAGVKEVRNPCEFCEEDEPLRFINSSRSRVEIAAPEGLFY